MCVCFGVCGKRFLAQRVSLVMSDQESDDCIWIQRQSASHVAQTCVCSNHGFFFFFFLKQFLNECILILPSTHPAFKDPSAVVMLTSFCSYSESENPCVYDSGYILTCVSLVWWIHYQGLSFTPVSLIRYYGKICVHSFGCSSWKNWHLK